MLYRFCHPLGQRSFATPSVKRFEYDRRHSCSREASREGMTLALCKMATTIGMVDFPNPQSNSGYFPFVNTDGSKDSVIDL